MKSNFKKCLAVTLGYEGLYSNNPKDPGGATMQGITQKVYDAYRHSKGREPKPVHEIARMELQEIYKLQYWDRAHCDELPDGVDLVVFDYAVNSGVGQAVKDLQRAIGCVVDGVAGVGTVMAAAGVSPLATVTAVCDRRMAFLQRLKTWSTFKGGWTARVTNVKKQAYAMAEPHTMETPDPLAESFVSDASSKAPPSSTAKLKTTEGAGLSIGSTGVAGQTVMTYADQVKPHISETFIGRLAFGLTLFMLVVGGGLVAYSYFKRMKEQGIGGLFG